MTSGQDCPYELTTGRNLRYLLLDPHCTHRTFVAWNLYPAIGQKQTGILQFFGGVVMA
jgi:hypothetical protein